MDDLKSPRARVFVAVVVTLAFLLGWAIKPGGAPESCTTAFQYADAALASVRNALPITDPNEFYGALDLNIFDDTLYKDYKAKCLGS